MDVRHRWPEEPEQMKNPSRYSETIKRRLFVSGLLLVILCCIVLFMLLFHDVLPDNTLLCIILCFAFTAAVFCVLYFIRRCFLERKK